MEIFTEVKYTQAMTDNSEENPQIDVERLKELMREKTWKKSDLAYYSGVKYDTVYSIVEGRRTNPQADTLNALATALGVTPDYLLRRSDHRQPPKKQLPEQIRQLATITGRLSEVRQDELVAIAQMLEELERREPVYTITESAFDSLLSILETLETSVQSQETALLLRDVLTRIAPGDFDLGNGNLHPKPGRNALQN